MASIDYYESQTSPRAYLSHAFLRNLTDRNDISCYPIATRKTFLSVDSRNHVVNPLYSVCRAPIEMSQGYAR